MLDSGTVKYSTKNKLSVIIQTGCLINKCTDKIASRCSKLKVCKYQWKKVYEEIWLSAVEQKKEGQYSLHAKHSTIKLKKH